MIEKTKIQLLPLEMEMIKDAGIILTKNDIMKKIKIFLEEFHLTQKSIAEKNKNILPEGILKILPKVSRGENYKGLPWLVLDYPRYFEEGNTFAIRTMFWWGNFFSTILHLSGKNKSLFETKIINNKPTLDENEFSICINQNEWEHHFEKDNYIKVKDVTSKEFEEIIRNKKFLKLANKKSLENMKEIENFLIGCFEEIVNILC